MVERGPAAGAHPPQRRQAERAIAEPCTGVAENDADRRTAMHDSRGSTGDEQREGHKRSKENQDQQADAGAGILPPMNIATPTSRPGCQPSNAEGSQDLAARVLGGKAGCADSAGAQVARASGCLGASTHEEAVARSLQAGGRGNQ